MEITKTVDEEYLNTLKNKFGYKDFFEETNKKLKACVQCYAMLLSGKNSDISVCGAAAGEYGESLVRQVYELCFEKKDYEKENLVDINKKLKEARVFDEKTFQDAENLRRNYNKFNYKNSSEENIHSELKRCTDSLIIADRLTDWFNNTFINLNFLPKKWVRLHEFGLKIANAISCNFLGSLPQIYNNTQTCLFDYIFDFEKVPVAVLKQISKRADYLFDNGIITQEIKNYYLAIRYFKNGSKHENSSTYSKFLKEQCVNNLSCVFRSVLWTVTEYDDGGAKRIRNRFIDSSTQKIYQIIGSFNYLEKKFENTVYTYDQIKEQTAKLYDKKTDCLVFFVNDSQGLSLHFDGSSYMFFVGTDKYTQDEYKALCNSTAQYVKQIQDKLKLLNNGIVGISLYNKAFDTVNKADSTEKTEAFYNLGFFSCDEYNNITQAADFAAAAAKSCATKDTVNKLDQYSTALDTLADSHRVQKIAQCCKDYDTAENMLTELKIPFEFSFVIKEMAAVAADRTEKCEFTNGAVAVEYSGSFVVLCHAERFEYGEYTVLYNKYQETMKDTCEVCSSVFADINKSLSFLHYTYKGKTDQLEYIAAVQHYYRKGLITKKVYNLYKSLNDMYVYNLKGYMEVSSKSLECLTEIYDYFNKNQKSISNKCRCNRTLTKFSTVAQPFNVTIFAAFAIVLAVLTSQQQNPALAPLWKMDFISPYKGACLIYAAAILLCYGAVWVFGKKIINFYRLLFTLVLYSITNGLFALCNTADYNGNTFIAFLSGLNVLSTGIIPIFVIFFLAGCLVGFLAKCLKNFVMAIIDGFRKKKY